MITKTVKRHYCEYCKKAMSQRPAMEKHEKHCTLNLNRSCRMCDVIGEHNDIKTLLAMIPNQIITKENCVIFEIDYDQVSNESEILQAFREMKEKANNCPACILAVLRQYRKENDRMYIPWDYKENVDAFWSEQKTFYPCY